MLHSSNQVSTCSKEIHENLPHGMIPLILSRNPMCSTSPTLRQRGWPLELLPRSNGPGFVRPVCVSHYAILIQQQKNGWTVTGLILLSPKNRMGKSIWLKLYLPWVELAGYKHKQREDFARKAIHVHHRLRYSVSIFRNLESSTVIYDQPCGIWSEYAPKQCWNLTFHHLFTFQKSPYPFNSNDLQNNRLNILSKLLFDSKSQGELPWRSSN